MSIQQTRIASEEYSVRWYEPADRDGILSLFETQWGQRPSVDWFDWKFEDDPYLAHVPINLAESDGQIVGVQAYVPCRLRWRDGSFLALKPADAVVHPDHRRQGLYTRITRAAIERYVDGEPTLFFNFPNAASLGAQEKLGWSAVDVMATYYRLQRPTELLPSSVSDGLTRVLDGTARAAARTYLGVRDRLASASGDFDIVRHDAVPAETLAGLYESNVPEEFHAHREAAFYRWALAEPGFEHATYVAYRDGRPVASLVVRTRDGSEVNVVDALPMASRHAAFADLLASVVDDNADADVLSVVGSALPRDLLARFGFVSHDRPVLSSICAPTYIAARPLWPNDAAPFPREVLFDAENWQCSFVDMKD